LTLAKVPSPSVRPSSYLPTRVLPTDTLIFPGRSPPAGRPQRRAPPPPASRKDGAFTRAPSG
jgi:hypothetical protein